MLVDGWEYHRHQGRRPDLLRDADRVSLMGGAPMGVAAVLCTSRRCAEIAQGRSSSLTKTEIAFLFFFGSVLDIITERRYSVDE